MILPSFVINDNKIIITKDWYVHNIVVKKGFISDGVSVPYVFRWFIHKRGSLIYGAIFHDYCYKNAIKSKHFADEGFYKVSIETGASKFKATLAYFTVKFFGKGNYK